MPYLKCTGMECCKERCNQSTEITVAVYPSSLRMFSNGSCPPFTQREPRALTFDSFSVNEVVARKTSG